MARLFFMVVCMVVAALPSFAQMEDVAALEAAARRSKQKSVLFVGGNTVENQFWGEDEQEKRAYEEEMRRRAYEEEMRRLEEERSKALRPVNLFGNGLKIYAEVNGEVITSRDMQDRVNVFVATTQIPVNAETKEMIIDKVLQSAIDEKIKLQEAQKNGINVSEDELNNGMVNFAKANNVSLEQFKQMLKQASVSEKVFKSQMKAEMAWGRLVQRKAAQEVQVSQGEINAALESVTKDISLRKYMLSEIVIPKKKATHIQDLVENLRKDPRFELYAMQFSESPSARNGGRLGWVNEGQLASVLEKNLVNMKEGDISNPIFLGNDYYILKLEKKYNPKVDKAPIPDEKEIKLMIENKKTEEIANKYLRDLRNKAIIENRG